MIQHKSPTPRLLSAGYLTLDAIVRDFANRQYWHAAGGTSGNVAVFASALGMETAVLARVGEDQRGIRLLHFLSIAGVDTSNIEKVPRFRTPGIIELIRGTPDGAHQFTYTCPACQTRLPKDAVVSKRWAEAEITTINHFDGLFFDRATPSTIRLAMAAREAGLLVMFEPPSVPRTANAECAAALSDIVKISLKPSQCPGQWRPANDAHTQFIVETLGAQGVRVRSRRPQGWSPSQECPAIPQPVIRDTAGAGDWLTAGILYCLLLERDAMSVGQLNRSIEYGQKLSAISLAFDGPQGALTELGAKTIKRIAENSGLFEIAGEATSCTTPEPNLTLERSDHCDLCLTEMLRPAG